VFYPDIHSVVNPAGPMLAPGTPRLDPLSARVAHPPAVPAHRDRCGRSIRAYQGDHHAPGPDSTWAPALALADSMPGIFCYVPDEMRHFEVLFAETLYDIYVIFE
jgi:hypothetical protein